MTKKIFINTFIFGVLILFLCTVMFFGVQYSQTLDETYDALRGEAKYAAVGIEEGGIGYLENLENINRITWIASDGSVLYDSEYPDLSRNQKECDEVAEALKNGEGQGIRTSDSGGVDTMYYAFRCKDGTVLRLSRPLSAVRDAIVAISPVFWVFLLALIISGSIAFRLARAVLKPISEMDIDNLETSESYAELEPLIKRIQDQKATILEEVGQRELLRQEFTANVSHELKTPLTSISGFAELMRDGMVSGDKIQEFSGDIYNESQRLIALVDDIMRLSKLDEGAELPEKEDMDLYSTSSDIVSSFKSQAEAKNITLALSGEKAVIHAIPSVIYELVYNLVDNSIKYNYYGGKVNVEVGFEDTHPFVCVSDTGIGIPEKEQKRVFERFYRVDKSHSKTVGGTGLGLSIVKHAAQLHDARIDLKSEPEKGTVIKIIFQPNTKGE